MLEERAVILAVEHDADGQSIARLEITRKTACGLCGQTRGCGNSLWGKIFAHKSGSFMAHNPIEAQVGDGVIVGIDESAVMKSALLLYMLPLATMFIVAVLVSSLTGNQLVVLLAAVLGLVLGLLWVKAHTIAGKSYFMGQQPKILRLDNA